MCNNNKCNCFDPTLKLIIELQNKNECINENDTCTKPYLGTNSVKYNTRPISFYTCCSNRKFSMPYTLNGTNGTSNVFRCESIDGCCCTCRVLAPNPNATSDLPYVATNNFFTMNLNQVGALCCLNDTYVNCL